MHLATEDQLLNCLREHPRRVLRVTNNADYVVEESHVDAAAQIATVDFDVAEKVVKNGKLIEPKEHCGTWVTSE